MLKKKIASAVAALAMAATMSVSALSASAACVHDGNTCIGEVHIAVWVDANNNSAVDSGETTVITHADGLIANYPTLNEDDDLEITFQTMEYHGATGSVTSLCAYGTQNNLISNNAATVTPDTPYTMTISYDEHMPGSTMNIVFIYTTPCNGGCGCGCN